MGTEWCLRGNFVSNEGVTAALNHNTHLLGVPKDPPKACKSPKMAAEECGLTLVVVVKLVTPGVASAELYVGRREERREKERRVREAVVQ